MAKNVLRLTASVIVMPTVITELVADLALETVSHLETPDLSAWILNVTQALVEFEKIGDQREALAPLRRMLDGTTTWKDAAFVSYGVVGTDRTIHLVFLSGDWYFKKSDNKMPDKMVPLNQLEELLKPLRLFLDALYAE